jgi:hypothetical protein
MSFPLPPKILLKTLNELFTHQGNEQLTSILRHAQPDISLINSDNWNGGTDSYSLNLFIPVISFAGIQSDIDGITVLIQKNVDAITKAYDHDFITRVVIIPDTNVSIPSLSTRPDDDALERIWGQLGFHLFISHKAEEKKVASSIKNILAPYGVACFVAHEDIEPTQIWQNEIELALASMHAFVAIVSSDFNRSIWCQQEIGFALGRGIPIFPLAFGADPSGFISKYQSLKKMDADSLFSILVNHNNTHYAVKNALISQFEQAYSWELARQLKNKLVTIEQYDEEQLMRIEAVLANNAKVKESYGVPEAIRSLVQRLRGS